MNFEDLTFLFTCNKHNRGMVRLDLDESACLFKTVKGLNNGIEIGRASGGSTILIASAIYGQLVSIDIKPIDDYRLEIILEQKSLDNVVLVVGDSKTYDTNKIIPILDVVDFVFIDGDHNYEGAKSDHEKFGALVKKGGYVIHHDMGFGRNTALFDIRLRKLKTEIQNNREYELAKEVGSLCVFRKL